MGVDYYQCDGCGRGYRDDSEYACYCDCGCNFCNLKCGKLDNYLDPATKDEPEKNDPRYQDYLNGECHIDKSKPITCVICRKESYTETALLEALLEHYRITRSQAMEIWKKQT